MNFETVSLLLNWLQMGALLAILFRLASTHELIANTQRELRRAIHHLGERRSTEPGTNNVDLLRKSGEFPVSHEELDETATTVYKGMSVARSAFPARPATRSSSAPTAGDSTKRYAAKIPDTL